MNLGVPDLYPNLNGFSGDFLKKKSFLLLARYDLDLQQSVVDLVDLRNFKVIHTWNPKFDEYNKLIDHIDEFEFLNRDKNDNRALAHHPILLSDGGLLINDAVLNKIDFCSNIIWQNFHDWFHHSLEVDTDENIWASTHLFPYHINRSFVGNGSPSHKGFLDDAIVKLSKTGKIIFEKSVSQILIDNGLEPLLFSIGTPHFSSDPIHLNDIQPVLFDSAFMKKGDVFLSLRHQSMVILYRPSTNKIIWKSFGKVFHQHDVDILDGNKISIFNNNSKNSVNGDFVDGHNEIITYDFSTGQYSSYLKGGLDANNVQTKTQGLSEILPNGDLFVEETNYGRLLYFNNDGKLIWSYLNRSSKGYVGLLTWSRILYNSDDLMNVDNLLSMKEKCND